MRRISPVIVAAVAMLPGATSADAPAPELIKVGVFTVAPYVMAGPGGPQGALIDFFDHEIAPRMGVRFVWQRPVTVARLETSLASGDVQFTPILAHTPQRDRSAIQFDGDVYVRFVPCVAVLAGHRLPLPVVGAPLHAAFAPSAPPQLLERYRKAAQQAFTAGRFDAYVSRTLGETRP